MRIIILPSYSNTFWFRLLGGTNTEGQLRHITFDDAGNPVFTGRVITDWTTDDFYDMQIVKYTATGTLMWQYGLKSATDPGDSDRGYGITRDPAGNLYVAGQRVEDPDAVLGRDEQWGSIVKFPSDGSSVTWQREMIGLQPVGGSNNNDAVWSEIEYGNTSAHVYAVGTMEDEEGTTVGEKALVVAKYADTGGAPVWFEGFSDSAGPTGNDNEGLGLVLDSSDNVYACGIEEVTGGLGDKSGLLVKYNSSGVFQWSISLSPTGGANYEIALENIAINTAEDRLYCVGWYYDPSVPQRWMVIARFSGLAGPPVLDWARGYGYIGLDSSQFFGEGITVDATDRVHVVGFANGLPYGTPASIIAEFDSSGNVVWDGIMGAAEGGDQNALYEVKKQGDSLYIAGRSTVGFGAFDRANTLAARIPANGDGRNQSYGALQYDSIGAPYGTFDLLSPVVAAAATPVPGMSTYTPAGVRHRAGGLVHAATTYTEQTLP